MYQGVSGQGGKEGVAGDGHISQTSGSFQAKLCHPNLNLI